MTKIVKPLRSGQITIPSQFREQLGIGKDTLLQIRIESGELRIAPVQTTKTVGGSSWLKDLYDAFLPVRKEAASYSEKEVNQDIDNAVLTVRKKHV